MSNERQATGRDAEHSALTLLQRNGLTEVARNYRCRGGEIDLVMLDRGELVFVEVRARRHGTYGGALASVDSHKQQRLILAARHYLATSGWSGPCRFDVVGFDAGQSPAWIRNAFPA